MITVNTKQLKAALTRAKRYAGKKNSTMPPICKGVYLAAANSVLTVRTHDLETQYSETLGAAQGDLSELVIGDIAQLQKLLTAPSTTLDLADNMLVINGVPLLHTMQGEDYPELTVPSDQKVAATIKLSNQALKKTLTQFSYVMASQDVRYYLNGAYMEVEPLLVKLTATDGHRLAHTPLQDAEITMSEDFEHANVILRDMFVKSLNAGIAKNDKGNATIHVYDYGWIEVVTGSITVLSKVVDGRYPSYPATMSHFDNTPRGNVAQKIAIDREALIQQVETLKAACSKNFCQVELCPMPESMQVSGNDVQLPSIPAQGFNGAFDPYTFGLNADYLLNVLKTLSEPLIQMEYVNTFQAVRFSEIGNLAQHIVMPLRLGNK